MRINTICLTLAISAFLQLSVEAADHPNFLVILTDDQSWVGTSTLMDPDNPDSKSDYYRTPQLDQLAKSGMLFTSGYASGAWCTPSRRGIQVAQFTSRHIYNKAHDQKEGQFARLLSMPRLLKQVSPDYQCAHFGKWHLAYETISPKVMGYDVSDGNTDNSGGEKWFVLKERKDKSKKSTPDVWNDPKTVFTLTQRTGDFIEKQAMAGKPWFVQLSHYAVHLKVSYRQETYDKLEGHKPGEKHPIREFAAMTEDLDESIGILMNRLKKLGALENTYVIFLSDNGGRGAIPVAGKKYPKSPAGRNAPLAMSKHSIYEGGLRVPFFLVGPGIKPNTVSRVPVSGVDILPTVADLAGYKGSLGDNIDGGSFKGVVLSQTHEVKRPNPFLVFHSKGGESPRNSKQGGKTVSKAAIRQGDYKLIKFYRAEENGDVTELYNLTKDVGENQNLVVQMPDVARRLESLLDGYMADVGGNTREFSGSKAKGRKSKASKNKDSNS